MLSAVNADSVIADGVLSSSNTDSAAADGVLSSVDADSVIAVAATGSHGQCQQAVIKATVFFLFMIQFSPLFCKNFSNDSLL